MFLFWCLQRDSSTLGIHFREQRFIIRETSRMRFLVEGFAFYFMEFANIFPNEFKHVGGLVNYFSSEFIPVNITVQQEFFNKF